MQNAQHNANYSIMGIIHELMNGLMKIYDVFCEKQCRESIFKQVIRILKYQEVVEAYTGRNRSKPFLNVQIILWQRESSFKSIEGSL